MRKIAIYNSCLERGGAERITVYLAKYFVEHNLECIIITTRIGQNEYKVPDKVKRISLNNPMRKTIRCICELRKILKTEKIDTLLVMGVSNSIFTVPAAFGLNLKVIVSERNDPRNTRVKSVTKYISRFLMKNADGFVFQTDDAKSFYDPMLKKRGCIIPNPLLLEHIPKRDNNVKEKRIVAVGRLVEQKNHKLLISTFSQISSAYPEYKLTIYGEGNLRNELKMLISEKNLNDKVELAGNVSDILDRIVNASAFVMSSDFEGMPNALIEAMALGIPCISTDCPCGGPKSLINHNENGLLVPVGDVSAIAKAIEMIITNEELSLKLGNKSKEMHYY